MHKIPFRSLVVAATIAVMIILATPYPGFAGPPGMGGFGGGMHGHMMRMEMMAEELNLSAEQRAQVEQIATQNLEQIRPHVRQVVQGRRSFRDLVQAESFDEAAAREVAQQQSAAMVEMMVARARQKHAIRQVLTEEQRQQLAERRREMRRGGPDE